MKSRPGTLKEMLMAGNQFLLSSDSKMPLLALPELKNPVLRLPELPRPGVGVTGLATAVAVPGVEIPVLVLPGLLAPLL